MHRRSVLRWGFALATALITSWIGLSSVRASADVQARDLTTCTRSDIAVYQNLMAYPEEEATAAYVLAISEAFLDTCASHPDARTVHLQAARASLGVGRALGAIRHFEAAQTYGYTLTIEDRMSRIAALLSLGRDDEAWRERDATVEAWLAALEEDGLAAIETTSMTDGRLYSIRFDAAEDETRIRAVWLAVPGRAGWPAAISIGSGRFRAAMHALRARRNAGRPEHLDLIRCRSKYTLDKSEGSLSINHAEETAISLLEDYLSEPDRLEWTQDNAPIATCIWPQLMLPRPDPWTAIALN